MSYFRLFVLLRDLFVPLWRGGSYSDAHKLPEAVHYNISWIPFNTTKYNRPKPNIVLRKVGRDSRKIVTESFPSIC
jgi:hypothetical protein